MQPHKFEFIELGDPPNATVIVPGAPVELKELARKARAQIMKHVGYTDEYLARYAWFTSDEVELLCGYAHELLSNAKAEESRSQQRATHEVATFLGIGGSDKIERMINWPEISDATLLYDVVSKRHQGEATFTAMLPQGINDAFDFAVLAAYSLKQLDAAAGALAHGNDAARLIADAGLAIAYATLCQPFIDMAQLEELPSKIASARARAAVEARDLKLRRVVAAVIEKYEKENTLPNGRIRTAYSISRSKEMQTFVLAQLKRCDLKRSKSALPTTIYDWLRPVERSINNRR